MKRLTLLRYVGMVVVLLLFGFQVLNAAAEEQSTQGMITALLSAIGTNNYDLFVANAAAGLKTRITRENFGQVSTQLAPRLNRGYSLAYLGNLRQQGVDVLLWRVVFQDGGDDMLLRTVIQDSRVAGLWFQ